MVTKTVTKQSQDSGKLGREARRTERLRGNLPRGIVIGFFRDGRKPSKDWQST